MAESTALQQRDQQVTGSAAVSEATPPSDIAIAIHKEREKLMAGIGQGIKISKTQRKKLRLKATIDDVDILPTGEIYVEGMKWREVLNEVFDPGGWGIRMSKPAQHHHPEADRSVLYREVFLVASRCPECLFSLSACECTSPGKPEPVTLGTSMGAQEYHPTNSRMTLDSAAEGATTNGVMRCCKVLGVYANIWDRKWCEEARAQIGVQVMTRSWNGREKAYWRRFDRQPLVGEYGLAAGSINADKYVPPPSQKEAPPRAKPAQQQRAAESKPAVKQAEIVDEPPKAQVHRIKHIRLVDTPASNGKLWVVSTDHGDFITRNERDMLKLENCKARNLPIVLDVEVLTTTLGPRKGIKSFRQADTKEL